ncbi:MAG TPA: hypothetical protein HA250_01720 [Nanoarchaeota archaeon]|nr:MAG: DNA-directed RNA polymerase subunit F [archaeon GW2011_AR6]MBS3082331.1 hypothetical protein [Candidatus Pacearchaeota archaeon]HIH18105.1 hypothetical protein [Nanoarchaeota archaeon]HIH34004.1 hypothetical protein [Nanoarchaeota archaeon]HIH51057.1 hypothetical protein [Nanoarchaeota archaeon]
MILKQEALTLAETKEILDKVESENPRIKKTQEYLKKFAKKKSEKAKTLVKKLSESEISKLKQQHIVKIVDVMPETPAELRSIFSGEELSLDTNETEKILQTIRDSK